MGTQVCFQLNSNLEWAVKKSAAPLTFRNVTKKLFEIIWKEVSKLIESISKELLCLLHRNFYNWYFIGIYILTGKIVQKYSLNDLEAWKFSTSHLLLLLACFLATTTPSAGPSWEGVLSNHLPPPNPVPHPFTLDIFITCCVVWSRYLPPDPEKLSLGEGTPLGW